MIEILNIEKLPILRQAAGLAAAMTLDLDLGAYELPISLLSEKLRDQGAVLEQPETTADTSRNGWKNNLKSTT